MRSKYDIECLEDVHKINLFLDSRSKLIVDVEFLVNPKFEIKWITFNGITMEIYGQKGVERIQRHELLNEGYQIFWSIPFANRNYTLTGSSNMLFTHGAMFGLQGNNIQGDTNNYFREDSCGVAVRKPDTNSNTDSDYISVVAIGTE